MLTFTPVTSRTNLKRDMGKKGHHKEPHGCSQWNKFAPITQKSIMTHKLFTQTHGAAHPQQQDNKTKQDWLYCSGWPIRALIRKGSLWSKSTYSELMVKMRTH